MKDLDSLLPDFALSGIPPIPKQGENDPEHHQRSNPENRQFDLLRWHRCGVPALRGSGDSWNRSEPKPELSRTSAYWIHLA